ncbi:hypothetical protein BDZ94DRAFT_1277929, partial [Collybia nuda]
MAKGKKRPPTPEESENEVFHVEVLMAARVVADETDSDSDDSFVGKKKKKKDKKGKGGAKDKGGEDPAAHWEYLVKWAGYESDANSWEPESNVAECQRLLKSFWAEFDDHERDYAIGDVIEPSIKWIKKEKRFFAREFSDAQEKLRIEGERAERERTKKTKKRSRKSSPGDPMSSFFPNKKRKTVFSDDDNDYNDNDNESHVPLRIILPAKRKEPPVSESSDDDDTPLSSQVHIKKTMKTGVSSRAVTNVTMEHPKKPTPPIPRRVPPIPKKSGTATTSMQRSNTTTPVIPQQAPSYLADEGRQNPKPSDSGPSLFSTPSSPVELPSNVPPRRPLPLPKPPVKTTLTIPPKIPRRLTNPHVKLSGMAPEAIASGGGISTKQRLAQGALAPTLPKAIAPPTAATRGRPTLPYLKTSSLMPHLTFKKNRPALSADASGNSSTTHALNDQVQGGRTPQSSIDQSKTTLAALNMRPSVQGSTSASPAPALLDVPLTTSPQEYTLQDPIFSDPFSRNATSSSSATIGPPLAPVRTAAEEFLSTIIPPDLITPLVPAPEISYEPMPPPHLVPKRTSLSTKIPKKWTWTGGLYFEGQDKPICNVTMRDTSGFRFSSLMDHWDRITFPSFHDVADVPMILLACKPPTHVARLAPAAPEDHSPMTILSIHIVKHQKVVLVPVQLNNVVTGHILFFHHVMAQFTQKFNIPSEVQEVHSLVAVFLPWVLPEAKLKLQWRKPPTEYLPAKTAFKPMIPDKLRWTRLVKTKPLYQHALRILKFPSKLHEFMSQEKHHRTYGLCPETSSKKGQRGLETTMLISIMDQCRAKLKSPTDARVVFIHISALKNLLKIPSLLGQRNKENIVQFYVYGTHHSISPELWRFTEVYQCGGVVTFTPLAILEDPIGVKKRIKEINEHPFWACYILPTVLGMTIKGDAGEADPITLFQDRGKLVCSFIPKAVTKGKLSLMHSPPDWTGNSREKSLAWVANQYSSSFQTIQEIMESALNAFNARYS